MLSVETIEKAVEELPPGEFAKFREWFRRFENDLWDRQIEADAAAGKLHALAGEALDDYKSGRSTEVSLVPWFSVATRERFL